MNCEAQEGAMNCKMDQILEPYTLLLHFTRLGLVVNAVLLVVTRLLAASELI